MASISTAPSCSSLPVLRSFKPSRSSTLRPSLNVSHASVCEARQRRRSSLRALPESKLQQDEVPSSPDVPRDNNGEDRSTPLESLDQEASTSGRYDADTAYPFPYGLVGLLGSLGLAETSYLTAVKLSGSTPICMAGGSCTSVLNSAYGSVLGVPLPAMGMAVYGSVAVLSGLALALGVQGEDERQLQDGLIFGSAALLSTSAILMYVLATRLGGEACPWCLASAGLSTGIAATVASGFSRQQLLNRVAPLATGASAAVVLTLGTAFSGIPANAASTLSLPFAEPVIASHSSGTALDMAKKLKDAGAKMYGAFWCSHCNAQKEYFGQEAMADFPYVECFPEGLYRYEDGSGTSIDKACSDIGIRGFPTWVINGEKYEGEQSFEKLEQELATK